LRAGTETRREARERAGFPILMKTPEAIGVLGFHLDR
jgi:hypothetical protein